MQSRNIYLWIWLNGKPSNQHLHQFQSHVVLNWMIFIALPRPGQERPGDSLPDPIKPVIVSLLSNVEIIPNKNYIPRSTVKQF